MSTSSESHESPILVTVRTFQPGDEESIWKLLNAAYPSKWGSLEWWRTKHSDRPGFDPLDIYVAEAEGRMLGCLHTAVIPVYVGPDLTVKLALDGDLAVHPDGRGRFIPERLYDFSRQQLYARGIPLRSGYTNIPLWEHIYKPRIGYISDFEPTRAFQKILDASLVRDRLLAMFHSPPDAPDPGRGPVLEVAITGIGKFQLRLARNVVATIPGAAALSHDPSRSRPADLRRLRAGGRRSARARPALAAGRSPDPAHLPRRGSPGRLVPAIRSPAYARIPDEGMSLFRRLAILAFYHLGGVAFCRWLFRRECVVLTYHGVIAPGPNINDDREKKFVLEPDFVRQMDYVRRHYTAISLSQFEASLHGGPPLPPRAVLITSDDGYQNNLLYMAPHMASRRLPGVAFLTAAFIGTPGTLWTNRVELWWASGPAGCLPSRSALVHDGDEAEAQVPSPRRARRVAGPLDRRRVARNSLRPSVPDDDLGRGATIGDDGCRRRLAHDVPRHPGAGG